MKKISLFIVSVLLLIPVSVLAATNPKVSTLIAEQDGTTINYEGTTEDGSYAVMCKLYNSDNEEIDLLSSAVENKSFSGSFTNVSDGTYNVACANYDGGEVKKVEVAVGSVTDDDNTASNPKTSDSGIRNSIILLVIGILGVIGSRYIYKKQIKNN